MPMARFLASALLVLVGACKHAEKAPPPAPRTDAIPAVAQAFKLDGELNEPPWNASAFRAVLAGDDGQQARPYSELRLLHDHETLYLGLYAADEAIRTSDAWDVTINGRANLIDAPGPAN